MDNRKKDGKPIPNESFEKMVLLMETRWYRRQKEISLGRNNDQKKTDKNEIEKMMNTEKNKKQMNKTMIITGTNQKLNLPWQSFWKNCTVIGDNYETEDKANLNKTKESAEKNTKENTYKEKIMNNHHRM